MKNKSMFSCLILTLAVIVTPLSLPAESFKSGYIIAHDGSRIYYEVHGTGPRFLLCGFQLQPGDPAVPAFVKGLGDRYRLVLAEYPPGDGSNKNSGEAKMYTFTPAAVARDYLEIAKAVGADEFAFYGYSWGSVCGLQLALRSERLKAFVAGGFPMINGPYPEILKTLRAMVFENVKSNLSWPSARQMLTYYEGLQGFDDRSIQTSLKIPRLNFVGGKDRVVFAGNVDVDFSRIFNDSREELKTAGWDVLSVPEKDHHTAKAPEIVVPLIRRWLEENWPVEPRAGNRP